MERFIPQQNFEQGETKRATPSHIEFEDRADGTYEKVSFLHESIETYKDDLSRIEHALAVKRNALTELEQVYAAHASIDALAALAIKLADRITMAKQAI